LPELDTGEYYWADLIGFTVANVDGVTFGTIDHLFETGSNDVMVVKGEREHLVPFIKDQVVKSIDTTSKRMLVDWPEEL
jgi:16S rRNA processing protein RimM